jgi:hypothetical protein
MNFPAAKGTGIIGLKVIGAIALDILEAIAHSLQLRL